MTDTPAAPTMGAHLCPYCHTEHVPARSTPAEALDVERLAEALDVLSDHGMEYALMAPEEREDRYDSAQRLAAEYARLSRNEEADE